jgi:hypothetical protein
LFLKAQKKVSNLVFEIIMKKARAKYTRERSCGMAGGVAV